MGEIKQGSIVVKKIKEAFAGSILETAIFRNEVTHVVKKDALLDICRFLKGDKDLKMNYLSDVVGVDYHPRTPRFEVVYHLYSIPRKHRLRLKIRVEDNEKVPSITGLWKAADCAEREAFDMFGIIFEGHPNLKRMYLADDWEGFPLRKDYPLKGYKDEYNPFGEDKG